MATVELTAENFNSTVSGDGLVLVDFWAAWCGPCRTFGPIFEKSSEQHPDAVFGKVDTEAQPEVAAAFNISSIPTLMIVRDSIVLYAQPGALPESALEQLIAKAKELDMDEVRASITAPQAPEDTAPQDTAPHAPEDTAPQDTAPQAPEDTVPQAPEDTVPQDTAPQAPENTVPAEA